MAPVHHPWVFIFGLLGNIISFMVYLAPLPTFWRIFKKKSTQGFSCLPYTCAIFSSMLWIYYALLKTNCFLLITINGFGCVVETIYILIFLTYAPKEAKMAALKLLVLLDFIGFATIFFVCSYLAKASIRVELLGWICVAFAVVVFAAPLSVIRTVIRTKSVEFMPFPLSLTLTISAVMWFMYGLLQKDLYIVLPNVGGFTFGVAQMVLYGIYRNHGKAETKDIEMRVPEKASVDIIVRVDSSNKAEVHPVSSPPRVDVEVVAVEENTKEDDDDSGRSREMQVHDGQLHNCGAEEIKMGSTVNPIQVVECVV